MNVLITGACGGLGSAMARQFAQSGADLLLVDKNGRELDRLSRSIEQSGHPEPGVCPLDLATATSDAYEQLASIMAEQYEGLDVLVHCAAAFQGLQPIEHISDRVWHETLQVNLNAQFMLTKATVSLLKSSSSAQIVFILEDEHVSGQAYRGAYGVSKAALASFAGIMEQELEGTSVSILRIQPGPMRTDLRARAYHSEDPQGLLDPEEVARNVVEQIKEIRGQCSRQAQ